jgi:glycosyltransferase involved in cell wall biosynthesis
VSPKKHIVLCTTVLGGAEIFALERLLEGDPTDVVLHCNSQLAGIIRKDERYRKIEVMSQVGLDGLASHITVANIATGVDSLRPLLKKGQVLLGNLRAAALMLHPAAARRNDAFIHDNSHYLNLKARVLIAFIVARSRMTFFPCHHSTLRVPFRRLLSPRMAVDYFGSFRPLSDRRSPWPACLKMAVVGRIEPAKNQLLALAIANRLARDGIGVQLTLVGSRSDMAYYSDILAAARHPAVELAQQEVPRSGIPALLLQQDMVVHTSIAESLPLVLFETNSLGVPFFALPVGGIPEVLPKKYWLDVDVDKSVRQIAGALYAA